MQSQCGKTAQISAVPRTKVKVSGGTQTCSSDLQQPHSECLLCENVAVFGRFFKVKV